MTVGNDGARLQQFIEDVRTFAGQTVTVSFWAKGTNPTTAGSIACKLLQDFGTGGSPSAQVNLTQQTFVLTANWTRYSFTFAVPSISGKTIGTDANSSKLALFIEQGSSTSTDAWTLDLWGVQVEAGSIATPFQTATGTIAGELAACQRYYEKSYAQGSAPAGITTSNAIAWNAASTSADRNYVYVPFKVTKRGTPTITVYSPITGASAKLYNALTSAGDKNASTNYIQDTSFAIYLGPTDGANAVGDLLLAHYVASAEL